MKLTIERAAFLKALGCDEYQGYHRSKPLPADEFERLLREIGAGTVVIKSLSA